MTFERVKITGESILYDPSLIELASAADFEPAPLAAAGRVVGQAAGRGTTWFLTARSPTLDLGSHWVLRHYRRGGLIARLIADHYFWLGDSRSRSFAEFHLLAELTAAGLPVPVPVAARCVRHGLWYQADLLTVAIPNVRTLATQVLEGVGQPLDPVVGKSIGQVVRRLHKAGVWHADLNAHNVLIDDHHRIWIIDFDRACRRAPGSWAQANLLRLKRSLMKIHGTQGRVLPASDWALIESGYEGV